MIKRPIKEAAQPPVHRWNKNVVAALTVLRSISCYDQPLSNIWITASVCRTRNFFLTHELSLVCNKSNTTGVASRTGSIHSFVPLNCVHPRFKKDSCYPSFSFLCSAMSIMDILFLFCFLLIIESLCSVTFWSLIVFLFCFLLIIDSLCVLSPSDHWYS